MLKPLLEGLSEIFPSSPIFMKGLTPSVPTIDFKPLELSLMFWPSKEIPSSIFMMFPTPPMVIESLVALSLMGFGFPG